VTNVLFCNCAYTKILPDQVKAEVRRQLETSGTQFEEYDDLCKMAAEKDPKLKELSESKGTILACFPRAVKWLFHAAGTPLNEDSKVLNMRESSAEEVLGELLEHPEPTPVMEVPRVALKKPDPWKPWFPVIDYDRCTNCMQCLSFCLFDVYGVDDDQKITVKNPTKCKTDCPACSRVCPEAAILFPKYRQAPINGAEVQDDDLRREKMKVDISSLLGGDIYQALRDRSVRANSRFSKERDEDRALKERKRCLKTLVQELDIPAEVLASLPSMDEIQSKAKRVMATKNSEETE